jgi:hypothetical protein
VNETMAKKNVAEVLVDVLVEAGVQRIYGVAGDSLNGITDTLRQREQIPWVGLRHEETAAFAAGAEAHLTTFLSFMASPPQRARTRSPTALRRRSSSCFLRSCSHTRSPDHRELSAPLEPAAGAKWLARNFLGVHGRNCTSEAHMEGEPADDWQALLSIGT